MDYNLLHFISNLLHFYHTTTTYYRIFIEKNIIFTRSFTTFIQFLPHIGTSIKAQIQGSSSLLFIRETLLWQIMVFLSRRVACWTSFKFTSILKKKLQILIRINSKKIGFLSWILRNKTVFISTIQVKWGTFSRWSSPLYYPMRNLDEMTMGKTHPTFKWGPEGEMCRLQSKTRVNLICVSSLLIIHKLWTINYRK